MATRQYCKEDEYAPGVFERLCRKHLQLRAIVNIIERSGKIADARAVRNYLALAAGPEAGELPLAIEPGEIPGLLEQMTHGKETA